jgi:hypothetical protein
MALRRRLLPEDERRRELGCSVLDRRWLDEVDDSAGVLVTAQGLLMYLSPDEVCGLVAACAARFHGGRLVFDAVPRWLAERSKRSPLVTSGGYRPPAWSWGLDRAEERRLGTLPHVRELRSLRLPRGRGLVHGYVLPLASRTPIVRRVLLSVLRARFD